MPLNLIDKISEKDKETICQYIYKNGIEEGGFVGLNTYLKYWAKAKPHLYHLLGGELIYKFPFEWEKDKSELNREINSKLFPHCFIEKLKKKIEKLDSKNSMDDFSYFYRFLNSYTYGQDSIDTSFKYKTEGKKMLQLQKGVKPLKALQKIIKYFDWTDLYISFEDFRIKHSMILNDRFLKGNACISIHPLDFMTMSDNDSNWSSCMSWEKNGCYSIGTVEMMNSNNVICCYLEASKPWVFSKNEETGEVYTWNNKKWRQLFYITNDILVGGKAYPYRQKDLSLMFLDKIKELSEKNLKRTYKFGPEPYLDMKHIGSKYRMDLTRNRIARGDTFKHNIIFDTKGMYNDFFNDHYAEDLYFCYRNKVKKTKLISVSGKDVCLCCGQHVLYEHDFDLNYEGDNYDGAYNDRYEDAGNLICDSCRGDRTCECCGDQSGYHDVFKFEGKWYCSECAKEKVKICPDCGNHFIPKKESIHENFIVKLNDNPVYTQDFYKIDILVSEKEENKNFAFIYQCPSCMEKKRNSFEKVTTARNPYEDYFHWRGDYKIWLSKKVYPKEEISKYLYENLKTVDIRFDV